MPRRGDLAGTEGAVVDVEEMLAVEGVAGGMSAGGGASDAEAEAVERAVRGVSGGSGTCGVCARRVGCRSGLGDLARGRWNARGWASMPSRLLFFDSGLGDGARKFEVDAAGFEDVVGWSAEAVASRFEADAERGGLWRWSSGGGWRRKREVLGVGDFEREEKDDRNASISAIRLVDVARPLQLQQVNKVSNQV